MRSTLLASLLLSTWTVFAQVSPPPLPPIEPAPPTVLPLSSSFSGPSTNNLRSLFVGFSPSGTAAVPDRVTSYLLGHSQPTTNLVFTNVAIVPAAPVATFTVRVDNLPVAKHVFSLQSSNEFTVSRPVLIETPARLPLAPYLSTLICVVSQHMDAPIETMDCKIIWEPELMDPTDAVQGWAIEHATSNGIWGEIARLDSKNLPGSSPTNLIPCLVSYGVQNLPGGVHRFRIRQYNIWGLGDPSNEQTSPPGGLPVRMRQTVTVTIQ